MSTPDVRMPYRHGVIPAAPYSNRAPSPPSIMIPTPNLQLNQHIKVVPAYDKVDPASLSADDLQIITQNKVQLARDTASSWTYESRRVAQPVLDFIYLGPSSMARDRKWLRENGITMLLAARDSQMANMRLMVTDKVAQELGLEAAYVDVSGYNELIRALPNAVRSINNHMLNVFRGQRISTAVTVEQGKMAIPDQQFKRGKVLVFCESGNDRSAGVVVAYLMSIFGMTMIEACQFVHFKRFCVSLTDELRLVLKSYEEILIAQRTVHRHELDSGASMAKKQKRGLDDLMGDDEDETGTDERMEVDRDRFQGRSFIPFVDANDDISMDEDPRPT
ncbi:phosphatases II [Hypoxylon sp. NC1633]|nr:phosphatases II [Hypoxylon sp. NC1633]